MKIQYRSILSSLWFQGILLEILCIILIFSGALDVEPLLLRFICFFSLGTPCGLIFLWEDINEKYEEKIKKIQNRIRRNICFETRYLLNKDDVKRYLGLRFK